MPEIRRNLVTGEWVIIATERARRPEDFRRGAAVRPTAAHETDCPFCPGNEDRTPAPTFTLPGRAEGSWRVRAVNNKFAALQEEGEASRHGDGYTLAMNGVGRHEVIVETPLHNRALALQPPSAVADVVGAYRERMREFYADPRVEHVIVFKNYGESAGTSLEHPHSQVVGTPIVPGQVRDRLEAAMRYAADHGRCMYCHTLDSELEAGDRIVDANASFVAFIPYAALSPFHLWVYPRRHDAYFADTTDTEVADLASILSRLLGRVRNALDDPDYNIVVRSLSPQERAVRYGHWYLSLVPRVTRSAGFELGTGMFINTALPEASAAFLRDTPTAAVPDAGG